MLGIVSDKDFELELNRSNKTSRVNSIPSISSNTTCPEGADENSHLTEDNEESLCGKIVEINKPGRRPGDNNVPDSLRKVIGATAIESGREAALNIANQFGISKQSVSAYSHGSTSTTSYNEPSPTLSNHVNNARERVIKKARGKLILSLNSLSQDKIEGAKARDIASIAKDMSAVIKNMEDKSIRSVHEGPKFIFYSPQFKDERSFDIINVKE